MTKEEERNKGMHNNPRKKNRKVNEKYGNGSTEVGKEEKREGEEIRIKN